MISIWVLKKKPYKPLFGDNVVVVVVITGARVVVLVVVVGGRVKLGQRKLGGLGKAVIKFTWVYDYKLQITKSFYLHNKLMLL